MPYVPFLLINFVARIAQSVQWLGYWLEVPMSNLGTVKRFAFPFRNVQTACRGLRRLLFRGYRCYFRGVKRPEHDAHSHPSSEDVNNEWTRTSNTAIHLRGVGRENSAFTCFLRNNSSRFKGEALPLFSYKDATLPWLRFFLPWLRFFVHFPLL
jgi:hypothetical protein